MPRWRQRVAAFGVFRNPAQARRAARAFPEDSESSLKLFPGKSMAVLWVGV